MSASATPLPLKRALLLSAGTGFLALGWELAWTRIYNFTSASRAIAFGALLGSYLLGLALGSLLSQRWQRPGPGGPESVKLLAKVIARAHVGAFLVAPLVSWLVVWLWWPWTLLAVVAGSAILGVVLPILCHLAIPPDLRAGQGMARIYLANIIGCGAGSLLTGFVFMDWLPLAWLCVLLTAGGLGLAAWLGGRTSWSAGRRWWQVAQLALGVVIFWLGYGGMYERLQYHGEYRWGMRFAQVVESKHGVITVDTHQFIYGNGAYDGTMETGLQSGSWLIRPYFISALRPHPRRVLVIGVSGGAWTQIVAHHPEVEEVVAVEISDAYLRIIAQYPTVASLLTNPKVHIVIDDGRRWLRRHPRERFDLILMNTTHHWREFASALLSREFLESVRDHLAEGGLAAWNCTNSPRAAKTGLEVFPHALMVINFFVGSLSPIVPDKARWRGDLERWALDGKPVFDPADPARRAELEQIVAFTDQEGPWDMAHRYHWLNRAHLEQAFSSAEIITDDNLGHEFAWGNW